MTNGTSDIAIIGGGISGLSLAILCARYGMKTTVFEAKSYPRHKVCGEFISNESRPFLEELGLDLESLKLPQIQQFKLTSHHGYESHCKLEPGGFGLSRFYLDEKLAELSKEAGVKLVTNTRIVKMDGSFETGFALQSNFGETYKARFAIGAWGRGGGLVENKTSHNDSHNDWIGIKYHLESGPDTNQIEIHTFENGYAGISAIENGQYCLAYLTKASALKKYSSNIAEFESQVLFKNKHLKERLSSKRLVGPVATSKFHFGVKKSEGNLHLMGDAFGFIPPLTGNGMSLAFRSSKMIFGQISALLNGEITQKIYDQHISEYENQYLKSRINLGMILQNLLFIKPNFANKAMMRMFSISPLTLRAMTKLAVGKTF